jgi:putative SOS response-associated peptidase YedK
MVATINHERMPVLLAREEEFETWLTGSTDDAGVQGGSCKEDRLD